MTVRAQAVRRRLARRVAVIAPAVPPAPPVVNIGSGPLPQAPPVEADDDPHSRVLRMLAGQHGYRFGAGGD